MDLLKSLEAEDSGPLAATCSRKGCTGTAEFTVMWNNPKIHEPQRRKEWLACAEHQPYLENFLRQRLFWRETKPFGTPRDSQ